jgi:hypothetical protein
MLMKNLYQKLRKRYKYKRNTTKQKDKARISIIQTIQILICQNIKLVGLMKNIYNYLKPIVLSIAYKQAENIAMTK